MLAFHEAVRPLFPERKVIHTFEAKFEKKGGQPAASTAKHEAIGYQLWSADRRRVIQVRKNGFACSVLAPYESWERLVALTQQHFTAFADAIRPERITRVAVRYINRIDLPIPTEGGELRFEDYLRTFPQISPSLPQVVSDMLMRVVLPRREDNATAIITEALERPDLNRRVVPVILDLDIFSEGDFTRETAWNSLERLRAVKNDIFFGCLTPRALELFQ